MTGAIASRSAHPCSRPWREDLARYTTARPGRALWDLVTSLGGYAACAVAVTLGLSAGDWWILAVTPVSAMFLLRTYIVFHDCTHGSFLPWRRANRGLGLLTGLLVLTPFTRWRHEHAVHHATAGDLDRRGSVTSRPSPWPSTSPARGVNASPTGPSAAR